MDYLLGFSWDKLECTSWYILTKAKEINLMVEYESMLAILSIQEIAPIGTAMI